MSVKWEYKLFSDVIPGDLLNRNWKYTTSFSEKTLNDLGIQGWELVSVTAEAAYYEKPITTTLLWVFKRRIE